MFVCKIIWFFEIHRHKKKIICCFEKPTYTSTQLDNKKKNILHYILSYNYIIIYYRNNKVNIFHVKCDWKGLKGTIYYRSWMKNSTFFFHVTQCVCVKLKR